MTTLNNRLPRDPLKRFAHELATYRPRDWKRLADELAWRRAREADGAASSGVNRERIKYLATLLTAASPTSRVARTAMLDHRLKPSTKPTRRKSPTMTSKPNNAATPPTINTRAALSAIEHQIGALLESGPAKPSDAAKARALAAQLYIWATPELRDNPDVMKAASDDIAAAAAFG